MSQAIESRHGSDEEMPTRQDGGDAPAGAAAPAGPAGPAAADPSAPSGASGSAAGDSLVQPFRIGRYTVLRRLGHGGMGVVYSAYDDRLDRKIALKLVYVSREHGSIGQARLLREAQALARLSHPNVVQIYEVGEHDRQVFLAMEFVSGATLRAWIRGEPRPWRSVLGVYQQAGRGLAAAHAVGLIHRDFKPDNAVLADDGRVRVLDFGLARALVGEPDELAPAPADGLRSSISLDTQDLSQPLTAVGLLLGTPAYMSPEQLLRHATDARSDQYSFCVAVWEALYRGRPFRGRTIGELKLQVFGGPPRPPRGPVPAHIGRVLVRGLAVDPAQRYPNMDALLAALADDPAQRRRRRLSIAAVGLALAGAGAAAYAVATRSDEPQACAAQDALAGVWDLATREAVAARFTASDLPFAAQALTTTTALLDGYAAQLQKLFRDGCEARRHGLRASRALELQASCAERRRGDLAALSAVLRDADAGVIERASQAAARLPAIDRCSDIATLLRDAEQAPEHDDPVLAARVAAQRQRLAAARAELDAGHHERARDLAGAVVEDAQRLADDRLLAEALVLQGPAQQASGAYPAAAQTLHRGFTVAEAAGHDSVAADAAVRLIHLHGERLHELAVARTWATLAEAKLRRIGDDGSQRARVLLYTANALLNAGRLQDSEPIFREAIALAEQRRTQDPNFYVIALNAFASFHIDRGALAEAEPLLRRSLALREAALGPTHPQVAVVLHNLGRILYESRDFTRAAAMFRRALEIRRRTLGPDHPGTVETLNGLGAVLCDSGQSAAGIEIFRNLLAIEEARRGVDHLELFAPLNNLGNAMTAAGDFEAAAVYLERARGLLERHEQTVSPDLALLLYNLAALRLETGARAEALALLTRSLAMREQIYGPTHLDVGNSLAMLAWTELALGRHDEARAHAERAVPILGAHPAGAFELGRARLTLAQLQWRDPTTRRDAVALARLAVRGLEALPGDSQPLQQARLWLATHH